MFNTPAVLPSVLLVGPTNSEPPLATVNTPEIVPLPPTNAPLDTFTGALPVADPLVPLLTSSVPLVTLISEPLTKLFAGLVRLIAPLLAPPATVTRAGGTVVVQCTPG